MKSLKAVFSLAFFVMSFNAFAQESADSELRLPVEVTNEAHGNDSPFQFSANLDLQSKESRLKGPRTESGGNIREISLGLTYKIQKEAELFVEGAAEEFDGETEFYVKQASINLDYSDYYLKGRAGQFFYPVGWLSEEDNYFLNQPRYYEDLFRGKKGLDLGALVRILPLKGELLSVEASCFEGRILRDADQRNDRAKQRPCALGLRSKGEYHEAFVTHFQHEMAFFDPLTANGGGLQLKTPQMNNLWDLGVWGEFWNIRSKQRSGPESVTNAGFVYPYVDVWKFRAGYRWSPAWTSVSYSGLGKVGSEVQDRLWRLEFQALKPLKLIYEDQKVAQKNGPDLTNEWSLRLLLTL